MTDLVDKDDELALVSMKFASINAPKAKAALEEDDDLFDDYMLALQLQMQNENSQDGSVGSDESSGDYARFKSKYEDDDDDLKVVSVRKQSSQAEKPTLLVDPEYDLIDPCPDIYVMFQEFDKKYFWNRLGSCLVEWSKRMTICAGIFYLREGGIIRLSEPLLKFRPRHDLVQTLLHEMIHAYLYLTRNFKDRGDHGDEFKSHMNRINKLAGTNITIYHSFHDEVNHTRQHVWRCTGPCRTHPPFYGYVKRSMNRAPGKNDTWWSSHQAKCNGQFEKISEPESYKKKKEKKEKGSSQDASKLNETKSKEPAKKRPINEALNSTKIDSFFAKKPKTPSPASSTDSSSDDDEMQARTKQSPPKPKSVSSITITKKPETSTQIDVNQKRLEFFYSKAQQSKTAFLKPLDSKFNDNDFQSQRAAAKSPELIEIKSESRLAIPKPADDVTILSNNSIELIDEGKNDSVVEWADDDVKLINEKQIECPVCARLIDESNINVHVNQHFS